MAKHKPGDVIVRGFHKPKGSTKITKKDLSDLRKDEHGKKYKNPPKIKRVK